MGFDATIGSRTVAGEGGVLQELTRQLLVQALSILCALQIDGLVLYLRVERTYRDDIRTLAAQLAYCAVGVAVGRATLV